MKIISHDKNTLKIQITQQDVDDMYLDIGDMMNDYLSEKYYRKILDDTGVALDDVLPRDVQVEVTDAAMTAIESILLDTTITYSLNNF